MSEGNLENSLMLLNNILEEVDKRYGDVYGHHVIDCPLCGGKDTMTVIKNHGSYDIEARCSICDDGVIMKCRGNLAVSNKNMI